MKISKKQLRHIISEYSTGHNHNRSISGFAELIKEMGPDRFAAALYRAIGDPEDADDMLLFLRRIK